MNARNLAVVAGLAALLFAAFRAFGWWGFSLVSSGIVFWLLQLTTRFLVPWSRWITPQVPSVTNRRFDTRFFVAAVPSGQDAVHDNVETTHSAWLKPRQALVDYWERRIELAPPQIMSLVNLNHYNDVAHAMQSAGLRPPPTIQPEPFDDENGRSICYPGDPRHSQKQPAMPGPSRLRYVQGRFEPLQGFSAFFV